MLLEHRPPSRLNTPSQLPICAVALMLTAQDFDRANVCCGLASHRIHVGGKGPRCSHHARTDDAQAGS